MPPRRHPRISTPMSAHRPTDTPPTTTAWSSRVAHEENFPVASWLCPPALRPAIVAIYHFARTADDIADEGDASAQERRQALGAYRQALIRCAQAQPMGEGPEPWRAVFNALQQTMQAHALPLKPFTDLLDAFDQDVEHTASGRLYANPTELLQYCERSANPIGRLLLHLQGVHDPLALQRSDAICTALQLINFWQDISRDWPRQRHYLPQSLLDRHGLSVADFSPEARSDDTAQRAVVRALCQEAHERMISGAPLVHQVPGRLGWELRAVVQGGLAVLDRIGAVDHRTWLQRPTLRPRDLLTCAWKSAWM